MRLILLRSVVRPRNVVVAALLFACAPVSFSQGVSGYDRERGQMMLDQVKNDIKSKYYDPSFHGVNLDATFKEASEKIKAAQSNGQIMGIIATAVFSLDDSHTVFIPPQRQVSTDYGWELMMVGDEAYVVSVKEKSDAEAKGLKVGDRVYLVDGYEPVRENAWKLTYLYYVLRPQPGMHLAVSSPGEQPRQFDIVAKVKDRKPINLSNYVDYMDLVRQSEGEERLRKKIQRLEVLEDVAIWKMPEFYLSADEVDKMMDKVRPHKALILDLRGNQGGLEETLLRMVGNLFDRDMTIGTIQRRKENKPLIAKTRGEKIFQGQLIVLVDSVSASSSEIFSRIVQLEKRGTVIGDRTSGAVMRSIVYPHEVGLSSIAFYGVSVTDANLKMSDGSVLEKNGVTPDKINLPSGADLAAKRDPVLSYAASLVGVTIDPAKAGGLFPPIKDKQ